jgi:hypothetical protein
MPIQSTFSIGQIRQCKSVYSGNGFYYIIEAVYHVNKQLATVHHNSLSVSVLEQGKYMLSIVRLDTKERYQWYIRKEEMNDRIVA